MSISFSATGTLWQIDIYDDNSPDKDQLTKEVTQYVEAFERNFSRFRDTSFVSKLAQEPGEYPLPSDAKPLLDFYTRLYELTGGLFTPCIGKSLVSAGYDNDYTLIPQEIIATPDDWTTIIYDNKTIKASKRTQLDFGGAGKGYLIDLVSKLLTDRGVENFCVDAGGDMRLVGNKTLTIGMENPNDTSMVIGTLALQNNSLCGSSGNRRQWGKYHHILNPKSLSSPTNILSTWVQAEDCMVADGLATSLFFVDAEVLLKDFRFEYLCLYSDLSFQKSDGLSATLFI